MSLVRGQTSRRPHFYDNTPVCRIQFAGQAGPATVPNGGEIAAIQRRSPHIPAFGDLGHLLEKNRSNRHSLPPGDDHSDCRATPTSVERHHFRFGGLRSSRLLPGVEGNMPIPLTAGQQNLPLFSGRGSQKIASLNNSAS